MTNQTPAPAEIPVTTPAPSQDSAKAPEATTPPADNAAKTAGAPVDSLLFGQKKDQDAPADKQEDGSGEEKKTDDPAEKKDDEGTGKDTPELDLATLDIPEGYAIPAEMEKDIKAFAAEMKLDSAGVQKAVDLHIAALNRQVEAWNEKLASWKAATESHPTLGGKNLPATVAAIDDLVRNNVKNPEQLDRLRSTFLEMGAGVNPDVIELLHSIAVKTKDDTVSGSTGTPTPVKSGDALSRIEQAFQKK